MPFQQRRPERQQQCYLNTGDKDGQQRVSIGRSKHGESLRWQGSVCVAPWGPRDERTGAAVYDRWRDVDGTHVPVGARVEQTVTDARMGALRSRLHRQGQVISRCTTRLVVRFDSEDRTVSIRPHLVRIIEGDGDCGG